MSPNAGRHIVSTLVKPLAAKVVIIRLGRDFFGFSRPPTFFSRFFFISRMLKLGFTGPSAHGDVFCTSGLNTNQRDIIAYFFSPTSFFLCIFHSVLISNENLGSPFCPFLNCP
ncbi:hypothetical protein CDAR_567641 [Caerostris darwini]|uniref:Uncharacterized protein n=1 Tax=Caerostris darwini TaxID=1538125 RepID=A0AAV4QWL8_9ARAC|nr:hypothetical protein CDAR_567641 [Caerostris darwini]